MEKRKFRLIGIVLAIAMTVCCLLAFAACGEEPEPTPTPHVHTYNETTWEKDDTNHWHVATCDHKTEKKDLAAHNTSGAGGSCSVCGYTPAVHEHTFNDENWVSDASGHWHAATCEHTTEKGDFAEHNLDGYTCSLCKFIVDHEHTYSTSYSKMYNTDYHWKKATCCKNYDTRYTDIELHNTDGPNGECSVCGFKRQYFYSTDECILCPECGGCLREDGGAHAEKEGHKKCGDGLTEYIFESKDAILKSGSAWAVGLVDSLQYQTIYCGGFSESGGQALIYKINADKDCTVTLRVRSGKRANKMKFTQEMSIFVGDEEVESDAEIAIDTDGCENGKTCFSYTTIGCIKLKAGENTIRITAVGNNGVNIEKIALLAGSDVTLTFTKTDNSAVTNKG